MKTISLIVLLIFSHSLFADSLLKLGPYDSRQEFKEVIDFLAANQITFQTSDTAVMKSLGFIVVTAPMDLATADVLVKDLRSRGVKDLLFIRKGVYQGRVSAGIYSSTAGADRRAAILSASGTKFGVIERQRTISSPGITIVPSEIDPSVVNRFEAFTGLSVPGESRSRALSEDSATDNKQPPETSKGTETTEPLVISAEPLPLKEPAPLEEPAPSEGSDSPLEKSPATTTLVPAPAPGKIIIQSKPKRQSDFPFIPFLLISSTILIVVGSFYFFTRRKTVNKTVNKEATPRHTTQFEEVIDPPTLTVEQEPPALPERQLDGSVGVISAYANQILSGQNLGEDEVPQYLATIEMGGTEVLDLISDIVDLSRIEIGQVEIERISFDPESALQDLIKSLLPEADKKGISLYFEAHDNLPDLIASDPGKIEKILLPLVRHAVECTSSGKVSVTAFYDESSELLEVAIEHTTDNLTPTQIDELFESSGSINNISNEKALRFAVSKRFASLLGGDIQVSHNSSQDIRYLITIQADEILKKQLLLPSGISIDELVESESAAIQLAENAKIELDSAQSEVRLTATALAEAESQASALTKKLEAAQSQASDEKAARAEMENKSSETISRLNLDLEDTKNKLQSDLKTLSDSEAIANSRVTELETALDQASKEIETQALARQAAEQSARDQVDQLSGKLIDAETQRDATTKELQTNSTRRKELEALQTEFKEAKTHLESELEARAIETDKFDSQINILQSQLAASKVVSIQETNNRVQLEENIQSLTQDWNNDRQTLEEQLTQSEQLAGENHLQAEHLAAVLKKARHDAESQETRYDELEQESREKLELLELELGIARQQAIEDAKQTEESISEAGEELNLLRQQLTLAETNLQEDLTENNNQHRVELSALESALSLAQQNLGEATDIKVRVEESSGSQIEALINDVNLARAAARKEAETRATIEKETQGQLDYMASELRDARKSLEAEDRIRAELDRVSEMARETSEQLAEAEAKVLSIQAEKEAAEQQILTSNNTLQKMKEEAEWLVISREASSKLLQPQASSVSSIDLKDRTPIRPSLSIDHPVLRSLIERFIERLSHQLRVMDSAIKRNAYLDLLVSVNWLKSEANNFGFDEFSTVISELELKLRQHSFEHTLDLVNQLKVIAARIELPAANVEVGSPTGEVTQQYKEPIKLLLPRNAKKAELQENFISQLGSKLMEMEVHWQKGDISRLQKNCRWIHRYSTKMNLKTIAGLTEKLQAALTQEDHNQISQQMRNFFSLYGQIAIERS